VFKNFPYYLSIFISLASCNSPQIPNQNILVSDTNKPLVVFVPGYRGSVLKDKNGEQVWFTGMQAIALSTPDLHYIRGHLYEPVESIRRITLIPKIISVDLYGPFLERFVEEKDFQLVDFAYDWRVDNSETANSIIEFLKKEKKNRPVYLIGHSNGGLLALSVTLKSPDLVQKLVLVGAPIRGGIGFMEDLNLGNTNGLNRKIASACVVQTFDLPYAFFPLSKEFDAKNLLLDENAKAMEFSFFQAKGWKDLELGPFSPLGKSCPSTLDEKGLQDKLDRAQNFRKTLHLPLKNPIPFLVVTAKNRRTRTGIKKTISGWDFENGSWGIGDGRVVYQNSLPKEPHEEFLTERDHMTLLTDPKVYDKVLEFFKK